MATVTDLTGLDDTTLAQLVRTLDNLTDAIRELSWILWDRAKHERAQEDKIGLTQ